MPLILTILEKDFAKQLPAVFTAHNTLDKFECVFLQKRSAETALLRVSDDIMMSAECTASVPLHLSTALDTILL